MRRLFCAGRLVQKFHLGRQMSIWQSRQLKVTENCPASFKWKECNLLAMSPWSSTIQWQAGRREEQWWGRPESRGTLILLTPFRSSSRLWATLIESREHRSYRAAKAESFCLEFCRSSDSKTLVPATEESLFRRFLNSSSHWVSG